MESQNMINYNAITEYPGLCATREQIERIYQRYKFASTFSGEKDVLEVACGSGLGLGYLAETAKSIVGMDIDDKNVAIAREYYQKRSREARGKEIKREGEISIELMDAHELAYPSGSFDLLLFFEAIYYLREPEKFVSEAKRVLKENGTLIIGTVNKDWEDFHPSPYTYKYFSVPELRGLLEPRFKDIRFYGGFPIGEKGSKDRVISFIKHMAVKFNLIPGSLGARAYLKRIFIGKLLPLPGEVTEGMASYEEPVEIPCDKVCRDYKIVYVVARG